MASERSTPLAVPRRRALIAAADAALLGFCRDVLADGGYECIEAATGYRALELLRMGPAVDLAVVEYGMPDMSGVQVIGRIRGELHLRALPVVFCPGGYDLGVNLQAIAAGAYEIFEPPFSAERLLDLADHLIPRKHTTPP